MINKKVLHKLMSLTLALVMMLTLMPTTSFADGNIIQNPPEENEENQDTEVQAGEDQNPGENTAENEEEPEEVEKTVADFETTDYSKIEELFNYLDTLEESEKREILFDNYKTKLSNNTLKNIYNSNDSILNEFSPLEIDNDEVKLDKAYAYMLNSKEGLILFEVKTGKTTDLNQELLVSKLQEIVMDEIRDYFDEDTDIKLCFVNQDTKLESEYFVSKNNDDELFQYVKDNTTDYFEGLSFDLYASENNSTISLTLVGDFDKTDDDWKDRDKDDFNDYIKYDLASELIGEYNKDVEIKVLDNDLESIYSKVVEKENSSSEVYSDILKKLKDDNDEFQDLKFRFILTKRSDYVDVKMVGYNFDEDDDEWEDIDNDDFDEFVEEIGEYVSIEAEKDVKVKVVDRKNHKLLTEEFYKDEYVGDVDEIEDTLNDDFDSYNGVDFRFKLTKNGSKNVLKAKADLDSGDRLLDEFDRDELRDFGEILAEEVLDKYPKDLEIIFYGRHSDSYTYKFNHKYFEKLKDFDSNWESKFYNQETNIETEYRDNKIYVELTLENLSKKDKAAKDLKTDKSFKRALEKEIADKLFDIIKEDVYISVKDKKDNTILYKYYKYKTINVAHTLRELEKDLKDDYDFIYVGSKKIDLTFSTSKTTKNPTVRVSFDDSVDVKKSTLSIINKTIYRLLKDERIKDGLVILRDKKNNKKYTFAKNDTDNIALDAFNPDTKTLYVNTLFIEYLNKNDVLKLNKNELNLVIDEKDVKELKKKNIKLEVTTDVAVLNMNLDKAVNGSFVVKDGKITFKNLEDKMTVKPINKQLIKGNTVIKVNEVAKVKDGEYTNNIKCVFRDATNAKYVQYVNKLQELKIINGYPDKTYKGDNALTRAEFSTLLYNYIKTNNKQFSIVKEDVSFADTKEHWAEEKIEYLGKIGLVYGIEDGKFNPDGQVSKAEALVMIARMLGSKEQGTDWKLDHSKFLIDHKIIKSGNDLSNSSASRYNISEYLYLAIVK